eukprot:Plantae.Rhodophyta-Purpureofilum_apyrenoidigerum.ctg51143.p1 GENE.Plantae.Rhodophyta-Purpureofilum_apyrenoidigerum.ctg51143~~Plantae.Rhodophyta-Purpureofilum_apyrenoidigerum.ctg51143.p1  ORF type:complete len:138 (-),score=26.84 Plantae.Rhodophyta-Purpureofilum_apyrenoidigerum.ctg51143:136-549(-)
MTAQAENLFKRLQDEVEILNMDYMIPQQREAFLCSARCCDKEANMQATQVCVTRCNDLPAMMQEAINAQTNEFSERFGRCATRCQDIAQTVAESKQMSAAEKAYSKCIGKCAEEFERLVPRFVKSMASTLRSVQSPG